MATEGYTMASGLTVDCETKGPYDEDDLVCQDHVIVITSAGWDADVWDMEALPNGAVLTLRTHERAKNALLEALR